MSVLICIGIMLAVFPGFGGPIDKFVESRCRTFLGKSATVTLFALWIFFPFGILWVIPSLPGHGFSFTEAVCVISLPFMLVYLALLYVLDSEIDKSKNKQ